MTLPVPTSPSPSELVIVLITVPDEQVAGRIAHALVSEKLAACVNVLPGWRAGREIGKLSAHWIAVTFAIGKSTVPEPPPVSTRTLASRMLSMLMPAFFHSSKCLLMVMTPHWRPF